MRQDADGLRGTRARYVVLVREPRTDHQRQSERFEEPFADAGDEQIGQAIRSSSTNVISCGDWPRTRRPSTGRGSFEETEVERRQQAGRELAVTEPASHADQLLRVCEYGNGRSIVALTVLKSAVVAPTPMARVRTATAVNPGAWRRLRIGVLQVQEKVAHRRRVWQVVRFQSRSRRHD